MDVEKLAEEIIEKAAIEKRYLIAVAGPPRAGKSTFSESLHEALERVAFI